MRNEKLTTNARVLRKQLTPWELKLWYLLRDRRLAMYKFRRQVPMGQYVVDFYCPKSKLIIELDGGQHNDETALEKDKVRGNYLKNEGFKILRIWNNELNGNQEGVIEKILDSL